MEKNSREARQPEASLRPGDEDHVESGLTCSEKSRTAMNFL